MDYCPCIYKGRQGHTHPGKFLYNQTLISHVLAYQIDQLVSLFQIMWNCLTEYEAVAIINRSEIDVLPGSGYILQMR
jgi:hypothetical protein